MTTKPFKFSKDALEPMNAAEERECLRGINRICEGRTALENIEAMYEQGTRHMGFFRWRPEQEIVQNVANVRVVYKDMGTFILVVHAAGRNNHTYDAAILKMKNAWSDMHLYPHKYR